MRVNYFFLMVLVFLPVAVVAGEIEPPSLALLEYLGEWQDENGNEIDPQELARLQLDVVPSEGDSDDEE
ncbi:MAG: hypothetical protein ABFS08_01085 [Pseudomonadota bacterium]